MTTTTSGDRLWDEIRSRGFAYASVNGTSMLPTLLPGEVVRLEPCDSPRRGDIVAFQSGADFHIHRVVSTRQGQVGCRGDNRARRDPGVPLAAVLGRAVAVAGPGRPSGVPLKRDRAAVLLSPLRLAVRRIRQQTLHAVAEARLVVVQARGGDPFAQSLEDLPPHWDATGDSPGVLITARHYSALTQAARVELLRRSLSAAPRGERLTVEALAATPWHRLALMGGLVRRVLDGAHVDAGRSGDALLPADDGRSYVPVHLFRPDEFRLEIERAGFTPTRIDLRRRAPMDVWSAETGD